MGVWKVLRAKTKNISLFLQVMNRQKSLTRIAELLGRFTTEVGLLNAAN